jgi:hypothetical protein
MRTAANVTGKEMSFDLPDLELTKQYARILYQLPPITLHEDHLPDGPSAKEKQQRRQHRYCDVCELPPN